MLDPLLLVAVLSACAPEAPPPAAPPISAPTAPAETRSPMPTDGVSWTAPDEVSIPEGPLGDSIRNGMDLFVNTPAKLPDYAPGNISCSNCHLDKGRKPFAVPMVGAHARFPKYMERTGAVITIQDRVNYCFTRSLAGTRLPVESEEMTSLVN